MNTNNFSINNFTNVELLANKGNSEAQFILGSFYHYGKGVNVDEKRSFEWYKLSAENGYDKAQNNLGICYINGVGVKKDFIKGFSSFELASKQRNVKAQLNMAICYMKGIGIEIDHEIAFELIVDCSFQKSVSALKMLAKIYAEGEIVQENLNLACYFVELANGRKPDPLLKYKAMTPTSFAGRNKINNKDVFADEQKKLEIVINYINNKIDSYKKNIKEIDSETYWMDSDQREEWVMINQKNIAIYKNIDDLISIKNRPYYARMDTSFENSNHVYYIGEKALLENNMNIVSVWSEYGRIYRSSNTTEFDINGFYNITLRRKIDIKNGELVDVFDEYVEGSLAEQAGIIDPYLIKVLEEKKGEPYITNIIRSIQRNQNDIIDFDFNKDLIVQGCAGSGKTMILLHRLANMKYNIPDLDLSKIKIITPNKQFNLFIDELSKNLGIEQIQKLTLHEYYILLLKRYRLQKINKNSGRETGKLPTDHLIKMDTDLSHKFVRLVYSEKFAAKIAAEGKKLKESDPNRDYGYVVEKFISIFENILAMFGFENRIQGYYPCTLYARLLFLYAYYDDKNILKTDSLLCIDEGQDITNMQYDLLKKINGIKCKLNIFGDVNQMIYDYLELEEWNNLPQKIDAKKFILNENYRNSDEIISYYDEKLSISNESFGLNTKPVEEIEIKKLATEVKLQIMLGNRTALITNDYSKIPADVMRLCEPKVLNNEKASLLTVSEAKGLEFDSVFVIDACIGENEKYIAYTRALSELYIVVWKI